MLIYKCPKCSSKSTSKDKVFAGNDSGDRVCNDCGYISTANQFKVNK